MQSIDRRSILRAKESKIEFEDFADCLIKGLGDGAKELRLTDEISKVYGFREAERWKAIVGSSENPENTDCGCKASPRSTSRHRD